MRYAARMVLVVLLGATTLAQQPINPRQQPGATVHIFALTSTISTTATSSSPRIACTWSGADDPEGWDPSTTKPRPSGPCQALPRSTSTRLGMPGTFEARLRSRTATSCSRWIAGTNSTRARTAASSPTFTSTAPDRLRRQQLAQDGRLPCGVGLWQATLNGKPLYRTTKCISWSRRGCATGRPCG